MDRKLRLFILLVAVLFAAALLCSAFLMAFAAVVAEGSRDTLLFGDRFPFRYLTDDYGLQYYAAFSGCSAETGTEIIIEGVFDTYLEDGYEYMQLINASMEPV